MIFLLIIIVVIFIGFRFSNSHKSHSENIDIHVESYPDLKLLEKIKKPQRFIVVNKKVKKERIVGTFYSLKDNHSYAGPFEGYAFCEDNPFDNYAVAIYNLNNERLGYIQRDNRWIHNSIEHYHMGKVYCWGYLEHVINVPKPFWYGEVFISVGLSISEIEILKSFYDIFKESFLLSKKIKKDSSDYESLIENYLSTQKIISSSKSFENIEIEFKTRYVLSYVVSLAKEQNLQKINSLDKYNLLITKLTPLQQISIKKKIDQLNQNAKANHSDDVIMVKANSDNALFQEWESKTLLWSKTEKPGYKYSAKKNAWWKQKGQNI